MADPSKRGPHGTRACYRHGCREPECVRAEHRYQRDYREMRRMERAGYTEKDAVADLRHILERP